LPDLGQTRRFRHGERRRKVRREAKEMATSTSSRHGHNQIHDEVKWRLADPFRMTKLSKSGPSLLHEIDVLVAYVLFMCKCLKYLPASDGSSYLRA
jgi:hypothetical protein